MLRAAIPHPGLSALMIVLWVLLVNDLSFGVLALGLVIGLGVPLFTAAWWPGRPRVRPLSGLAYCALVVWDIVIANLRVARIILLRPARALRPAWLVIPIDLATPEAIAVLAGTISLTPGTVSADISACGRFLLVHALDVADPGAEIAVIKRRYEARLKAIFA